MEFIKEQDPVNHPGACREIGRHLESDSWKARENVGGKKMIASTKFLTLFLKRVQYLQVKRPKAPAYLCFKLKNLAQIVLIECSVFSR